MVNITLSVEDVYAIAGTENKIGLKFSAMFTWFELRAFYFKLNANPEKNVLQNKEKAKLWVPEIGFQNKKEKYNMSANLADNKMFVLKQGYLRRFSNNRRFSNIVQEFFYFKGDENPLAVSLTNTVIIECTTYFDTFPFDKQVFNEN